MDINAPLLFSILIGSECSVLQCGSGSCDFCCMEETFKLMKTLYFQLVLFSRYRYSHVNYVEDMQTTLRSIFLRDWGPERESVVYPPGLGPLSIYTKTDFFSYLEHAVNAVSPKKIFYFPS